MYFIDEDVSFEIVDIFDVIKRKYGRDMLGGFSHEGTEIAKELINQLEYSCWKRGNVCEDADYSILERGKKAA